jgi:hypothetical protein
MTPERKLTIPAPRQQTPESELLAKVEFFRMELDSIVPSEIDNARSRSLVNYLGLASRDIAIALRGSDKSGAPLDEFESNQKEKSLESWERYFGDLLTFRTELSSLIDSQPHGRAQRTRRSEASKA